MYINNYHTYQYIAKTTNFKALSAALLLLDLKRLSKCLLTKSGIGHALILENDRLLQFVKYK